VIEEKIKRNNIQFPMMLPFFSVIIFISAESYYFSFTETEILLICELFR